jgi:phage tail-like protein
MPDGLAIDECGQIYFIDGKTCQLFRYDLKMQRLEQIPCVQYRSSDCEEVSHPPKIIIDNKTLWILDTGKKRVKAYARENFQIKYIIDKYIIDDIEHSFEDPVDIKLDYYGNFYVLDRQLKQIIKYDNSGIFIQSINIKEVKEPVGLVISKETSFQLNEQAIERLKSVGVPDDVCGKLQDIQNRDFTGEKKFLNILATTIGKEQAAQYKAIIFRNTQKASTVYVIDNNKESPSLFWFKGTDYSLRKKRELAFSPAIIVIDSKGTIFVADQKPGIIHQFDADGSYLGIISDFKGPVNGLAVDSKGNLYVSTNKGIAFLSIQQMFTKEKGFYYSKTMDSGIQDCQWHRLALKSDFSPKTVLEVSFFSSDDSKLKKSIDDVISDPSKSTQEKIEFIENRITWIEPKKNNPEDMLFRGKSGRYLWLKLALSTFDEKVRPTVTQMKVFYPRISYLRYLPAIYQEDPVSREFLERFLSLFETVFFDLETAISQVFKYFDPDTRFEPGTKPHNYLTWLASWLNMAVEEEWPEEKKQSFIRESHKLYKLKGTPTGIKKLVEIYTGVKPLLIEHSRTGTPMVLGGKFTLGVNSLLLQTPVRGFRLGDDSILGWVALRDKVLSPEDPFLPLAHNFTVILDLSPEKFGDFEKGLRRILDEGKPAHTAYALRIAHDMRVGRASYVGISTRLTDHRPIRLGVDSALGSGLIAYDNGEPGGKVSRHSKIEVDTRLM